MNIDGKIITTEEQKQEVYEKLKDRFTELGLEYETSEQEVKFTEVTVTLKLSKLKMVKHLFTLVHAPEEEIKYLTKVKSIVLATARDILNSVLQSVRG